MEIISQREFIEKFKDIEEMRNYVSKLIKQGYILLHPANIEEDPMNYSDEPEVLTPSGKNYKIDNLEYLLKDLKPVPGNKDQIEMLNSYNLFLVQDYLFSQENYF